MIKAIRSGLFVFIIFALVCSPVTGHAESAKKRWVGWQCVTYARQISPVKLFGNAWTWWQQAVGKYDRGHDPKVGSVLVFQKSPFMRSGHVAVVREMVNEREILVEHANWAPAGANGRGKVTEDAKMIDVSPNNDWTEVRVWYEPVHNYGRVNQTYGFIYSPGGVASGDANDAPDYDPADITWNNNG